MAHEELLACDCDKVPMYEANFTSATDRDGYFGAGKVPHDLAASLPHIATEFAAMIPPRNACDMTFHAWYHDFPPHLQALVDGVRAHAFWGGVRGSARAMVSVAAMDELYYSVTPNKHTRGMLYGATGNYDLHVDGMFSFPGIRFYRVLIGLTHGNTTVETSFPGVGASVHINAGDYVVFDFDKARHRVTSHSESPSPRMLLKLHFCVSDTSAADSAYVQTVCSAYRTYEGITRYIMQTGTNPVTLYQFVLGLLCYVGTKSRWSLTLYTAACVAYAVLLARASPAAAILGRVIWTVTMLFVATAVMLWLRYTLFGIR